MTTDRSRTLARLIDDIAPVPLPGSGRTAERYRTLTALCHNDIADGRLIEAHLDADAILNDLGGQRVAAEQIWAVWAAESADCRVDAVRRDTGGWELSGDKPWCSGMVSGTHALVTAYVDGRRRLFAVDLGHDGVQALSQPWVATGMRATETGSVRFHHAPATAVGEPGQYLERPGFWHGGIGVAACWLGGTRKVADTLYAAARRRDDDITLMHLGAVDALLAQARAVIEQAATAIDERPTDQRLARRLALQVRWNTEQVATSVIDRVARALGPGPLVHDDEHAQAVADLTIYIRQSHADRDLVTLGTLVNEEG